MAKKFASDGGKKGTVMVITIKNNGTNGHPNYCYYISELSKYPQEKEILFSSHCYFSVNKIIPSNSYDYVYLTCNGCYPDKI